MVSGKQNSLFPVGGGTLVFCNTSQLKRKEKGRKEKNAHFGLFT